MSTESQYKLSHRIAKFIVYLIICGLLVWESFPEPSLIGIATKLLITTLWFWGINFIAHLIEVVCKFNSKHDWV